MGPWSSLERERLALLTDGRDLDYSVLWAEGHCVQRESDKVLFTFPKPSMRVVLPGSGEEVKLGADLLGYG